MCSWIGIYYVNNCKLEEAGDFPDQQGLFAVENGSCVLSSANDDLNEVCGDESEPVCSTEGELFRSNCELEMNGAKLDSGEFKIDGEYCVPNKPCNENIDPVCSDEGVYFSNICKLQTEKSTPDRAENFMVQDGKCILSDEDLREILNTRQKAGCGSEIDPVCSDDGKHYLNGCLLEAAGYPNNGLSLFIAKDGACIENPGLQNDSESTCDSSVPVCDNDGNYFVNQCLLENEGATPDTDKSFFIIDGVCLEKTLENCSKFPEKPLCSFDGQHYQNECYLYADGAFPDNNNYWEIQGVKCVPNDVDDDCSDEYAAVCSNDGYFYENICQLEADGSVKDHGNYKIDGEECVLVRNQCKKEKRPVCSDDGNYFENRCEMRTAGNYNADNKFEAENGVCVSSSSPCTKEFRPVCSTDGRWFSNRCLLKAEGLKVDRTDFQVVGRKCIYQCQVPKTDSSPKSKKGNTGVKVKKGKTGVKAKKKAIKHQKGKNYKQQNGKKAKKQNGKKDQKGKDKKQKEGKKGY